MCGKSASRKIAAPTDGAIKVAKTTICGD